MDDLPVQRVLRWVPDMNRHLAPFGKMTGWEVRQRCGYSVPWVALWACLGQKTAQTAEHVDAIRSATPSQLLRLAATQDIAEKNEGDRASRDCPGSASSWSAEAAEVSGAIRREASGAIRREASGAKRARRASL